MTRLTVYADTDAERPLFATGAHETAQRELARIGVLLDRRDVRKDLPPEAGDAAVLAAYGDTVEHLKRERGYGSADVVRILRGASGTAPLRAKFLNEHTHSEDEARFFVEGSGAFYLHVGDRVFVLECSPGDLLSVPAGAPHWFDMGADPHFTAIRFFTAPNGWAAALTGDPIADRFPKYESAAELA